MKCKLCTMKHLGAAYVLLQEALGGYPLHCWIAIGHYVEAERECPSPELVLMIRAYRKSLELPDWSIGGACDLLDHAYSELDI